MIYEADDESEESADEDDSDSYLSDGSEVVLYRQRNGRFSLDGSYLFLREEPEQEE